VASCRKSTAPDVPPGCTRYRRTGQSSADVGLRFDQFPTGPIASALAISTWTMRSIRPSRGHGRRPQNAGSDKAPMANIAPSIRSASGRCRYKAVASPKEVMGADRAVPHSMTTAGFRTSSEPPMPKGSPGTRCFIATAPPAESTARRAMSSRLVVISTRAVCPASPAHTMVRRSRCGARTAPSRRCSTRGSR